MQNTNTAGITKRIMVDLSEGEWDEQEQGGVGLGFGLGWGLITWLCYRDL